MAIQWKILNFFHIFSKSMYYKILQLHAVSKNNIFLEFDTCPRNGSLGADLVKT